MTSRKQIRYDPTNDYYTILGLESTASFTEIHRAYRQLAKEVHPDLNRDRLDWAHGQFQKINDAHDTLGDPDLRAEYDTKRNGRDTARTTQMNRANSSYAQASRAAWAKRNRRRQPGYAFIIPAIITLFSCWMLRFSQETSIGITNQILPTLEVPTANSINAPSEDSCSSAESAITFPSNGATVIAPFDVIGRATGETFASYTLQLAYRTDGGGFIWLTLVSNAEHRVDNASLAPANAMKILKLFSLHGNFMLRLVIHLTDGTSLPPCDVAFHLS